MPRNQPEFEHQAALVAWARLPTTKRALPGIELLRCSLNGVHLSQAQAGKAKAAGMLKGELDLQIPVPKGGFVGLWIEMKYGRNKTTPEQEQQIELLRQHRHRVEVCYEWPEARRIITEYLSQGELFDGRT
jgi:hypothetical protein